ncbi:hypothetical protein [Hymenobacter cavernae]|uniref:hypothetical protein n=1 Tax=Hymenobacter cavernae TaxID=2044852 RepID=UPI001663A96B|nr:hypothetical protein [Hymenobacter cavernae]
MPKLHQATLEQVAANRAQVHTTRGLLEHTRQQSSFQIWKRPTSGVLTHELLHYHSFDDRDQSGL